MHHLQNLPGMNRSPFVTILVVNRKGGNEDLGERIWKRSGAILLLAAFFLWALFPILPLLQPEKRISAGSYGVRAPYSFFDSQAAQMEILRQVAVAAHRGGAKEAPENTMEAFYHAVEAGCEWIELDVQQSKDGVLMVYHDDSMQRLTGAPGNIWDYTCAQLQQMKLQASFPSDTGIPTFEQVLQFCRGKIKLNVELKENEYNRKHPIIKQAVALLQQYGFVENCCITAYSLAVLEGVKREDPRLQTACLYDVKRDLPLDSPAFDWVSMAVALAEKETVSGIWKAGKQVQVWVVNREEELDRMLELGIGWILTDRPEWLMRSLNARKAVSNALSGKQG